MMKVLGIDTTFAVCAAAIVAGGRKVLSNETAKFPGGFSNRLYELPPFHLREAPGVLKRALAAARTEPAGLSLVAVGNGGSLSSAIAIGVAAAGGFAAAGDIPVLGVDHQEAHLYSNWLERAPGEIRFPVIALSASGATSSIALIEDLLSYRELSAVPIGGSAGAPLFLGVGTAYTFLGQRLGLGTGEALGHLVSCAARTGDPSKFVFAPPARRKHGDLDFSWLKEELDGLLRARPRRAGAAFPAGFAADLCAGFESSISGILVGDLLEAAEKHKAREVHLAGGISANAALRAALARAAAGRGLAARAPVKPEYCTDNAAMIAGRGYYLYKTAPGKHRGRGPVQIFSDLKLDRIAAAQFLSACEPEARVKHGND